MSDRLHPAPETATFGAIRLVLEIIRIDGVPVLSVVASSQGPYGLAVQLPDAEDESWRWLFAPLNDTGLHNVLDATISVREAFENPNGPCLFVLTDGSDAAEPIIPAGCDDLPGPAIRLSVPINEINEAVRACAYRGACAPARKRGRK